MDWTSAQLRSLVELTRVELTEAGSALAAHAERMLGIEATAPTAHARPAPEYR